KNNLARMLKDDCKIHIQESEKFLGPVKSRNSQMYIEFNDLCYSVCNSKGKTFTIGTEKMILHNARGYFEPGKITVVVGPSGAGKTTLLKIISGKQQHNIKGTITVNGAVQNRKMFHKQACYVPQQFELLPYLTIRETLYIAARLKLDVNQNKQTICSTVNDIAKSLNLSKCLDTLANKLSGGERKRVCIGVEMIVQPSVFLLDEPTSGLDSMASNQLINILHDMAKANCTVICSIHQPSSQMISLFDNIIVLNQGRCMYCGPKNEILNTYSIAGFTCPNFYNIIEFVLEVVTEERSGNIENLYKICCDKYEQFRLRKKEEMDLSIDFKQKCGTKNTDVSINSITQKKSTWQQQKILFSRALTYIKRDTTLTKLRFVAHVQVAILLGIVFYNFVPTEAAVFLQEHLNNWYSLRSYYSVKIITDLLVQIICCSSFVLISYYMTGQPMEYNRILSMWGICFLITMLAQTVGVLAGTMLGTELGIFVIPSVTVPLLLFAGFFSKLGEMPMIVQPLSYLSFFRYALEGLMQAIYLDRPNLTCSEIYCYFHSPKPEKTILQNVTGYFESKKVTVIIGPSGAGKTTLMKIISGKRLTDIKGTITINGIERNKGTFRKQVCYVPQQLDLLPFLTTKETLYIAARLKLNVNESKQTICSVVNDVAETLGLSNCLGTLANKLSGGEQKRLSIAIEIIAKPSILLLDEPTSGLDSAASYQLVYMLHDMSRANCTVICAIHQPSSQIISLFDDIMVLSQGRSMYCGPKSEILNTYSIAGFTCPSFYNIAEFVLEVITEQRGGDLENLYKICRDESEKIRLRNAHNKNELTSSIDSKQKCETNDLIVSTPTNNIIQEKSIWQQQKILFVRALICIKRDTILTKVRLASHIIVALMLGTVFYDFGDDAEKVNSNIACLFFFLLFLFFVNAERTVQTFPTEAAVFLKEHLNNWYSLGAYYSVKVITDLVMQILCSSAFIFISYYMTGQPMEYDRILKTWIICLLIMMVGQTVGILAGSAFGTEFGLFLISSVNIPLLLFAGFFTKVGEMSPYLQPLSVISYFRYAFEGIIQAIYVDRPNLTCFEIYCYLRSPSKILSMMDMPTVPFYAIPIILISWILFLHAVHYTVLQWKVYYAKK
ncbi:ATP-binding cassette sub-family G member 4, partial [Cyphomyrmex costatus]